jgi:universal stress protein E
METQPMSLRVRRILVAIRDGHSAPRSELRKAASLARALGANIELFHSIAEPLAIDSLRYSTTGQSRKQTIEAITQRSQQRLAQLARSSLFKNLSVRTPSSWDYPAHEAIVRRAQAMRAELVVSATQPQRRGVRRLLLTNTDWELIRHCPYPLLLVKSSRDYRKPAVIAAVDPFHANAKPARSRRHLCASGVRDGSSRS